MALLRRARCPEDHRAGNGQVAAMRHVAVPHRRAPTDAGPALPADTATQHVYQTVTRGGHRIDAFLSWHQFDDPRMSTG